MNNWTIRPYTNISWDQWEQWWLLLYKGGCIARFYDENTAYQICNLLNVTEFHFEDK